MVEARGQATRLQQQPHPQVHVTNEDAFENEEALDEDTE